MIRVVVMRDEGYTGVAVRTLLQPHADIACVGSLTLRDGVAHEVAVLGPRVVVIDTAYMVSQILPYADEVRAAHPTCALLLLCDPAKRGMLPPRHRRRALNFLLKDASGDVLADAVRRLARGEQVVSPRLQCASLHTDCGLTTRELEVLGLAAAGDSVQEIAGRLFLSGGTVRNYLSAVITKTGARNRLDAIRIVRRDGWLH